MAEWLKGIVKTDRTSHIGRLKQLSLPVLALFFVLLPAFIFGVISLIYYYQTGNAPLPMPQWNDEAAYYELVKTWIATGAAKGYWGFSGGHAILGTGGAWSPAILFPYVIWGMMFGWNYSSVAFANVVFLCIINALVLLVLKPQQKGIIRLLLVEILSCHLWLYMNTIMSEVLRYGLGILLAAMLYHLLFGEETQVSKVFAYVVVPAYIVVTIQIYIFFAFSIPIYVFAILKRKKWWNQLGISLISMAMISGGSYYLLHLISSNYNIYKTEILLQTLKEKDIWGALRTFLWMFKVGVLDLWNCFRSMTGYGMFHWFVPLLILFVVLPVGILLCDFWKQKQGKDEEQNYWTKDRSILLTVSYSIAIFVVMYITVYSLEAFTFYRGVGIVLLFSLVLLTGLNKKSWFVLGLFCYALGLYYVPKNMPDFNRERYPNQLVRAEWEELADQLESALTLQKSQPDSDATQSDNHLWENNKKALVEQSRWRNTVVLYTMEPKLICSIPPGFGVNFAMYSKEIVEEAEYLVFSLEQEKDLRGDWLEHSYESIYEENSNFLEQNYYIQYADQNYVIYRQRKN